MAVDIFSFESAIEKLNSLSDAFRDAVKRVVNSENAQFNSDLDDFDSNITSIIVNNTIGESLETLFESYNLIADNAGDQYLLFVELFAFGDDDTPLSFNSRQTVNNISINNTVQIDSLAYAYNSAVQITYGNQTELDAVIDTLDTQYQKLIYSDISSDLREALLDLRTNSMDLFSQLNLRSIVSIETTIIPSTVLSYQYYGDSTQSDSIISLNKIQNTGFIEGTLQVLST